MFSSKSCISTTHNSFISSDERLSIETSGYESLNDGKFTESTQVTKCVVRFNFHWSNTTVSFETDHFQIQQQQQLYSLYKNTKVGWFAPQIAGELIVAGQDKYTNSTNYLIKNKNLKLLQIALKMTKTQKLSDLISTAFTDVQCIKTRSHWLLNDNREERKADIKTFSKCIYVATF